MAKKYTIYRNSSTIPAHIFFTILSSLGDVKPQLILLVKDSVKPRKLTDKGAKTLTKTFESIIKTLPAGFFNTDLSSRIAEINILQLQYMTHVLSGKKREATLAKNEYIVKQYDLNQIIEHSKKGKSQSYIDNCTDFQSIIKIDFDPYKITLEQFISYQNKTSQIIELNRKRNG